jgi:hypothetical protein
MQVKASNLILELNGSAKYALVAPGSERCVCCPHG